MSDLWQSAQQTLGQLTAEEGPVIKALLWVIASLAAIVSGLVGFVGRAIWKKIEGMDTKLDALPKADAAHEALDVSRFASVNEQAHGQYTDLMAAVERHGNTAQTAISEMGLSVARVEERMIAVEKIVERRLTER